MCDYYAFACRFQCLPETHHFSSNWISHIVAYIWLITNDGVLPLLMSMESIIPKSSFLYQFPPLIMILHKRFSPKKVNSKSLLCANLFVILIRSEKGIFLLLNSSNTHHCQGCSHASNLILLKKCYQTLTTWPQCSSVA